MCKEIISGFLAIITTISTFFGGLFLKPETVFVVKDPSINWEMQLEPETDGNIYVYCCEGYQITANDKVIYTAKDPKDVTFEKVKFNRKNIFVLGDKVVKTLLDKNVSTVVNHLNDKEAKFEDEYTTTEKASECITDLCDMHSDEAKFVEKSGTLYFTFRSLSIILYASKKVDSEWQISISDINYICWHIVANRCLTTVS